MDFKTLQIFARVAVLQNLSQVANEMDLAAGTISKRIQALENDVSVRLLERTTRSIRLTDEGRMFLNRVDRILSEMDHARDELNENSGKPAGRLTVSVPATLQRQFIEPAMLAFARAYPQIEVRVDITDNIANLHERGYDVAIRAGTLPDSMLKAKRLASDPVILAAAPAYIAANGAPQKPSDLERHTCLIQCDQRNWSLYRSGDVETIRVSGRLVSDNGAFLHHAALDGLGILKASHFAISEDLASGALLQVLPEYELAADAAIWAVYPNHKHPLPRLRVLLDFLADYCRQKGLGKSRRQPSLQAPPQLDAGPCEEKPKAAVEPVRSKGTARNKNRDKPKN